MKSRGNSAKYRLLIPAQFGLTVLDRVYVFDPSTSGQTPVGLMVQWCEEVVRDYRIEEIWLDPMQLLAVKQHFEKRIDVVDYNCGVDGLVRLAETLKSLVTSRKLHLYKGAGALTMPDGTVRDLVDEVASLTVQPVGNAGKYRFQHRTGLHDDMTIGLAMGCVGCLQLPLIPPPSVMIIDGSGPMPGTEHMERPKSGLCTTDPVEPLVPKTEEEMKRELMQSLFADGQLAWQTQSW